jgi:hypothetical protein
MTSDVILRLLRAKHSEDVFVPECKDGPTQSVRSFAQIDAWVMPRSWSHPHLTGYEIKVSRSDFLGDEKWRKYLPCCNYLYFAAPPGIIHPHELSPEVGLLEASSGGARLFTKKKAQYREIPEPSRLFRYVLMSRANIGHEIGKRNSRAYWEEWMRKKELDFNFGHNVSKAIAKRVTDEISAVARENNQLKERMESYDSMREVLKALGLPEDVQQWRFQQEIQKLRDGMSHSDKQTIRRAHELLGEIVKKLLPEKE